MKTFVIIPHYILTEEVKQLAINTINSIRKTSDTHIISVNDGSPMDCSFLKELSDDYVENKENSGFAKTCNKGFEKAFSYNDDNAYIVCANNDIEVFDGWLKELIRPFNMFDNVGITGLISNRDRIINGIPIEKFQIKKITSGGLLMDWMQSGGLWLSTKKILNKVGLFDEQFERGGCEDIDLFLRIRDSFNYKIVMSGFSCFWHKEGATRWNSLNNFGRESKAIEIDNNEKFFKKWNLHPLSSSYFYTKEIYNE